MKKILILIGLLTCLTGYSQIVDTIIQTPIYTSYYSFKTGTPLFVSYVLYNGGGNCKRDTMKFRTYGVRSCMNNKNYAHSGFDIGHLANAEDFSFDCLKESLTFRFINALPQKPRCNRGCWKHIETKTRTQSKKDSLLVICGGFDFKQVDFAYTDSIKNITIKSFINAPGFCYKIVKNLRTKQIDAYLFPNDDSDTYEVIDIKDLLNNIPYSSFIILRFKF